MEKRDDRKLRGGYYTPKKISDFTTNWVIQDNKDQILEPSCGDGEFIESAIGRYLSLGLAKDAIASKIKGVELIKEEANKVIERFKKFKIEIKKNPIVNEDFFKNCKRWMEDGTLFNGVIGNPPFIRYQDFKEEYRNLAIEIMQKANLKPSKLINAWIPFLIGSTLLLKRKGRLGMVLPAELFQVNYAAETREFLSKFYSKIYIITFKKLVFEDIQQEVVIFLGEKNGNEDHGINVIEVKDADELKNIDFNKIGKETKRLDHSKEKWTQYFLDKNEIDLLRKIKDDLDVPLSNKFIDVDVGVVTGQNKYFLLNKENVDNYSLSNHVVKIFSKSNHIKGLIASQSDWNNLQQENHLTYLLTAPDTPYSTLPINLQKYIDQGVTDKVHTGYKCSIRKNWWAVPSVWIPDAFMLRQVHNYPKLVYNKEEATATDTIHRVKFVDKSKANLIVPAFLNSLTFAFSEITGRSYGGGVLTFEPTEAERLPLPINGADKLDLEKIDLLIRENKIDDVLDITDKILLEEGLGLSKKEVKTLRGIWVKLRDRRINRRN